MPSLPANEENMATRRTRPTLSRQRQQKPVRQPTQQTRSRITSHLDDAIGATEDLFHEHGADCECEVCCLVTNMVGAVRVFRMLLEIT